ncbi:hypothetical protein D3C81_2064550 [compost metagenome]
MPGGFDPEEGRCAAAALGTGQALHRQGQGADLATVLQPGQLGLTGDTQRVGLFGGVIAEQTEMVTI